jgi:hypothetical protein
MYQGPIYCKMQIYSKNDSKITTFDELFNHILNISWLYHFNSIWKIPFIWFHKKHLDEVFHSNNHNYARMFFEILFPMER